MEIISRKDAHAKGLKRFYTGKPCKRGHDRERNVRTGACLGCLAHYSSEYSKKNNDALFGFSNVSVQVHPDDFDAIRRFAGLIRVRRLAGKVAPIVPAEDQVDTVNTMIQMMQPATVAPPPVPTQAPQPNAKHAMWVRIHGREVADQMLASGM